MDFSAAIADINHAGFDALADDGIYLTAAGTQRPVRVMVDQETDSADVPGIARQRRYKAKLQECLGIKPVKGDRIAVGATRYEVDSTEDRHQGVLTLWVRRLAT